MPDPESREPRPVDLVQVGEASAMLAELAAGHNPARQEEEMAALMVAEVKTRQHQHAGR